MFVRVRPDSVFVNSEQIISLSASKVTFVLNIDPLFSRSGLLVGRTIVFYGKFGAELTVWILVCTLKFYL